MGASRGRIVEVVVSFDREEMARRGRIGAHRLHATHDPHETTRAARAGQLAKFERDVDPDNTLTPEERTRRALHARKAFMARIALKSARTRARKARSAAAREPRHEPQTTTCPGRWHFQGGGSREQGTAWAHHLSRPVAHCNAGAAVAARTARLPLQACDPVGTAMVAAVNQPPTRVEAALTNPDPAEIRRALDVLHPHDGVIELRAIGVRSRRWPSIASGYFLNRDLCAAAAADLSPHAEGVYVTLNQINPALLARAVDRVRERDEPADTTADHHVIRRQWLPIDCHPVRPKGIPSTDQEKEAAFERARDVREYLWTEGWDTPILADSGNGAHLLYRIDLQPDDGGYVQQILTDLGARFTDSRVSIDQTVFNPARIWKLYGSLARKGDHAPVVGRPHRVARLLEVD
jgi:hypothetical protein